MPTDETITLDPVEFSNNRVELGLDELGIRVREAEWGDSEIEMFLVRQALGEIPADRHPPNRNPVFKLRVEEDHEVSLAEAAQRLQQKVGIIQRESGFVRRDLDTSSGFLGPVAARVHNIALGGIHGWMMAHRKRAPDVTLSLVTDPYLYGVEEIESELIKVENAYYLKWEIEKVLGSAPGLLSLLVKNEGASAWKGLISSIESRDHPQDETKNTTADLVYECENLTPKGGATKTADANASGGSTMQHSTLTGGFIQILNSKILATNKHMTHIGPRRFWVRATNPGLGTENIELRLEWRTLGSSRWNVNKIAVVNNTLGSYGKFDLGECRPEPAVLGEQQWEWAISARARNGTGSVRLDLVFIHPIEQMLEVTTPDQAQGADQFSTKSPVSVASAGEGKAWVNPANAATSNNVYATVAPSSNGELSQYLTATNFGFAIPEGATIVGILAEVERKRSGLVYDKACALVKAGVRVGEKPASGSWGSVTETDSYATIGGSSDLWETAWTPADINNINFGVAYRAWRTYDVGTLSVDHIKITVYYTEASDENRVCFASRSLELRSDGIFRQHPTDDVWGRGVPDGFLPFAAPSGLEGRSMRGLIVPSVGDHDLLSDTGSHKLSVKVRYFPGYHFTSEAE